MDIILKDKFNKSIQPFDLIIYNKSKHGNLLLGVVKKLTNEDVNKIFLNVNTLNYSHLELGINTFIKKIKKVELENRSSYFFSNEFTLRKDADYVFTEPKRKILRIAITQKVIILARNFDKKIKYED